MSSSFAKSLTRHLEQLVIGPPLFAPRGEVANMIVYPLFPTHFHPDPPDLITLSEAMRRGARLSDTGVVSRVHIDNPLPTSILASESEILIGPTQHRVVQFSCLIPPDRRTAIPVSCVEEGQPIRYQAEFTHADASPWQLRSYKMEQLAHHGDLPQYWLWDNIKSYLRSSRTLSTTHDLHAVFDRNAFPLQNLSNLFPCQPGQVGAICAVDQNLFLELFGDPEILEDRYNNLLRSALVEAIAYPGDQVVPPDRIADFMDQIVQASQQSKLMQSRGLKEGGRSLAFADRNIRGAALVADGHLIHLAAHQRCLGQSQPFVDLRADLEASQEAWAAAHPSFVRDLQQEYADRRKRYQAFKEKLKPPLSTAPTAELPKPDSHSQRQPGAIPPPLPLSSSLRDFFLHLFRRL